MKPRKRHVRPRFCSFLHRNGHFAAAEGRGKIGTFGPKTRPVSGENVIFGPKNAPFLETGQFWAPKRGPKIGRKCRASREILFENHVFTPDFRVFLEFGPCDWPPVARAKRFSHFWGAFRVSSWKTKDCARFEPKKRPRFLGTAENGSSKPRKKGTLRRQT